MTEERTTIDAAISAWEAHGPTSLTVALLADALYGAREDLAESEAEVARQYHEAQVAEARVARIEAQAAEWERRGRDGVPIRPWWAANAVRAALAGPAAPERPVAEVIPPIPTVAECEVALAANDVPAEVEQVLSDVWSLEGVQRWWTSRNTMLRDRVPRDVYREGPEGAQAVIDLANHLADGNW